MGRINTPVLRPVSYTHLDVYKRQQPFFILHFKKNGNDLTGSGRPAAAGDLFPVFFRPFFRFVIVVNIVIRMNEQDLCPPFLIHNFSELSLIHI